MIEKDNDLFNHLLEMVDHYVKSEESFGDAAQLRINPKTLEVSLTENPDEDLPEFDYYDVNDLIMPLTDGTFSPDKETILAVADSYFLL